MKKTLIALAAVAASGAALAQSSVTLYGAVDANITHVKGKESVTGVEKSGLRTSRIGFKGVEDLGNGLKAEFVLESGMDNDDGTGAGKDEGLSFKRQSTVGLSGNFGTVRLGRELTASYNAVSRYDVFGTTGIGSAQHWDGDTGYQSRYSNGIAYYTPSFAGFQVGVNLGLGEQAENRDGRSTGAALTYDNGPISFGLGYDVVNNALPKDIITLMQVAPSTTLDVETVQVGGSYNFGVAKLALGYKQTDYELSTPVVGVGKAKLKGFLVGVSAPVGANGEVKFSYNNYKATYQQESDKANQFALGYVHNLSKRTALYGTYAMWKNKDKDSDFVGLNTSLDVGGAKNGKQHGFQFGIRHNF